MRSGIIKFSPSLQIISNSSKQAKLNVKRLLDIDCFGKYSLMRIVSWENGDVKSTKHFKTTEMGGALI